jgi:hypothetical protein
VEILTVFRAVCGIKIPAQFMDAFRAVTEAAVAEFHDLNGVINAYCFFVIQDTLVDS